MYHPSKNLLILAIKIQYLQIFVYNIIHVFIEVKILNSVVAIQSKSPNADSNIMDQGFLSKISRSLNYMNYISLAFLRFDRQTAGWQAFPGQSNWNWVSIQ